MTTMLDTIIPKSDQLNADDLIGGRTLTIRVSKVSLTGEEQPVAIHFEGDNGKPYRPGKSMRRVLVNVWGPDANAYVGRSMTLYRDEKVLFGGVAVGGIRISHMSNIDKDVTMALTATRANRKPFTVKPLRIDQKPAQQAPAPADDAIPEISGEISDWTDDLEAKIDAATDKKAAVDIFNAVVKSDEWAALRMADADRAARIKGRVTNWA